VDVSTTLLGFIAGELLVVMLALGMIYGRMK